MSERPELVFVSPRFLFPPHSGGAIRTGQILKGMKGGRFRITLLSPGSPSLAEAHRAELEAVADAWEFWPAANVDGGRGLSRAMHLLSALPASVAADRSAAATACVRSALARKPAVVVVDFVHAAVLVPDDVQVRSVLFTHNCEAEIFERHATRATAWWWRLVWRGQARKMRAFEGAALRRFDQIVTVADRDGERFASDYGVRGARTIPTGVDAEYFSYAPPLGQRRVVFTGGLDWPANADGIEWFMDEVWPTVLARVPDATMTVVGKNPPPRLVARSRAARGWTFTGRVPDVRPFMTGADAFAIPLHVGSGTRIKAYEAMAAGVPLVSTSIGIEGLGIASPEHFMRADDARSFADSVVTLLTSTEHARGLAQRARAYVEANGSSSAAARLFEEICWRAVRVKDRCLVSGRSESTVIPLSQ